MFGKVLNLFKKRENKPTEQNKITTEDIDIFARTLYGEARGESVQGIEAVASVIMNRYKSKKWYSVMNGEHSITAVCLKPAQFSCWNIKDPNRTKILCVDMSNTAFALCWRIACDVAYGNTQDTVNGATHYYAKSIKKPKWANSMKYVCQIGNHRFYKEK